MTGRKNLVLFRPLLLGLLFYTVKSSADTWVQKSGSPGFAEHELPEHKVLNGEELGPKISIHTQVDVAMHGGQRHSQI